LTDFLRIHKPTSRQAIGPAVHGLCDHGFSGHE
jgi:hypothetical protein